jgi:hypothetical protein
VVMFMPEDNTAGACPKYEAMVAALRKRRRRASSRSRGTEATQGAPQDGPVARCVE